jgi:signal transduction histidine kinase
MNDSEKIRARAQVERYVWILAVMWAVAVAVSLVWNVVQIKHNTLEAARIQARSTYDKDIIYRRWNAGHGGVYVTVTEVTQPNPYLSDIHERDITTPLGKLLTLMNPAYMTRQVHELAEQQYGVRGHITSLNPIRPENAPGPWETEALQAFERGETEVSLLGEMKGKEYMRLMRPLTTEKGCLKCHAAQGYQEGDIRGGISVSVPMEPLWAIAQRNITTLAVGHILLWLIGLGWLILGTQRLRRSERERNRAEEELKKYAEQLEAQAGELAQAKEAAESTDRLKSTFLASMSHELRTPLNSIIGFTGVILQGMAGDVNKEQRKQLTMVENSASHLLSLINDVLDISKVEAGKVELSLEEFRLDDIAGEVVETLSPAVNEKGLELVTEVPDGVMLFSDRRRMKQVLMNLAGNAVKFTDQGNVTIAARVPGDENLEIRVTDTGIGIKKEHMDKLFQPFPQIDVSLTKRHEGTGLGLHLSKKLVTLLGGDISAKSEYGRGSEFTFTIPLKYQGEQANEEDTGS